MSGMMETRGRTFAIDGYRVVGVALLLCLLGGAGLIVVAFFTPGRWGGPDFELLGSGFYVAFAALIQLAFVFAWRRRRWRTAVVLGTAANVLFVTAGLVLMWTWDRVFDEEVLIAAVLLGVSWAAALALGSLLSFARLPAWSRYVRLVTWVVLLAYGGSGVFFAVHGPESDEAWRWWFATMTLSIAGSFAVLVLHLTVGARQTPRPTTFAALRMQVVCPRCELSQEIEAGPARCRQCGLRFTLEIEEERCRQCGYTLYQLTSQRCPECGHALFEQRAAAAATASPESATPPPDVHPTP